MQHVDVLRALAGVEEGHLGSRSATDEDALLAQHPEEGRVRGGQRLLQLLQLGGQLGGVGMVDGRPHRAGERRGRRGAGRGGDPGPGLHQGGPDLRQQVGVVAGTEDERATQRGLGCRHRTRCGDGGRDRGARRRRGHLCRGEDPGCRTVPTGHVLLEHDVEVGPTEPEGAQPGAAHPAGRFGPGAQLGVDLERDRVPVDVLVGVHEVEARGEHLLVEGTDHLEHPGGAGRGLEVADVGLHRAERDRAGLGTGGTEDGGQAPQLRGVSHAGRGAMSLDGGGRGGVLPRVLPGPLDGELLAHGVGRGDALALPVRRAADAQDHRVDVVARGLGVLESLQHEEGGALPHHEAVGSSVERAGARRGQCADLAELHERVDAHVGVEPAGDDGVEVVLDQAVHGGVESGEARRAGRVGGEVGSAQVEEVGHAAGDHVGQLTGHRVLGDLTLAGEERRPGLVHDAALHVDGEGGERRGGDQVLEHLGQLDPHARHVVLLAADGVAEDDRHPVGVDAPARPAGIDQGAARGRDGPPLAPVHLIGDHRRDGQLPGPWVPRELLHPPADLGVGLVRDRVVRVEVERRVPPPRRHVGDAVAPRADVLPERIGVGGPGHDRRGADHGHGPYGVFSHCWSFVEVVIVSARTARRRRGPCLPGGRPAPRRWRRWAG